MEYSMSPDPEEKRWFLLTVSLRISKKALSLMWHQAEIQQRACISEIIFSSASPAPKIVFILSHHVRKMCCSLLDSHIRFSKESTECNKHVINIF